MKAVSAGLQAHLDTGATTLCWCWKIERADNVIFGFTDHDRPLTLAGVIYEPDSGFAASELRGHSDLSVDAQDAEGVLSSDRITETDILDGRWDNARIEIWRVNWADVSQRILMRRGNIGQVRRGKAAFVAEVRSLAHVLNQTVGRTFQYYCDAALGDARCGVNLEAAAHKGTGAIAAVSADRTFTATGLSSFASSWFDLGLVEWTSGVNAGRKAEIARHVVSGGGVSIELFEAPVRSITVGDGFIIRAGCDKQFATCKAKFANGVNFRGFPYMPGDDTILRYANRGDGNTGEPL
ncbi:MAG: DUF2163 domain-containing protein [Alphaproteobacteria bacterium]|nr:DUF2163 domain-containing protein [Alphaproteobacteria bacterium]